MFSELNPIPTFPKYRGPHNVGTAEYEIPTDELHSSSEVPDATISTIKFRIFYPAQAVEKLDLSVTWLPEPQREWMYAYCEFLKIPQYISRLLSYSPLPLKYTILPAGRDAPLLPKTTAPQWPVLVFSHGLGGSCNAYSHLLGSLASCGLVCVAPEHRDQSAPIALIRQADRLSETVGYQQLPHEPSPEVLGARNLQLRIRIWELGLLYTAFTKLNDGEEVKNLAGGSPPCFKAKLNLDPSKVTWAGHSFGAATMVQLVKSVYWHQSLPDMAGQSPAELRSETLYTPADQSNLKHQITMESPIALLDLWTMPLRGDATRWLFERPLPCFAGDSPSKGNVLAIMSEEFYRLDDLMSRVKAVLSRNPAAPEVRQTVGAPASGGPRLFFAPKSAHLSQSDFVLLSPWAAKKWMQAEEPERTLTLNTRAILQLLRESHVTVEKINLEDDINQDEAALLVDDPSILAQDGNIQGWKAIPISN